MLINQAISRYKNTSTEHLKLQIKFKLLEIQIEMKMKMKKSIKMANIIIH